MFKKLSLIFSICIFAAAILDAQTICMAETPAVTELYSKSCALMDGDSGRILYGKEADLPLANASTTKIMTCILALENARMDGVVTASANAASQPKVRLGMQSGEQFYLQDLLYALMLESYNDCAVAIAEHICGSTEAFSEMMNNKAKEIGCTDTDFITPNGLDAKNGERFHHTTAQDLCRIMKYCVWESPAKDAFLAITQTQNHSFCNLEGRSYSLTNHNAFLSMMDGVLSGKTGFTGSAGYCYVAAMERDGKKFCIALLACGWPNNKTYKWKDARKLFEHGIADFEAKDLFCIPELPEIKVSNAMPENADVWDYRTDVFINPVIELPEDTSLTYLVGEADHAFLKWDVTQELTAPITERTKAGFVAIYLNEEKIAEYPVYVEEVLGEWNFREYLRLMWEELFLFS